MPQKSHSVTQSFRERPGVCRRVPLTNHSRMSANTAGSRSNVSLGDPSHEVCSLNTRSMRLLGDRFNADRQMPKDWPRTSTVSHLSAELDVLSLFRRFRSFSIIPLTVLDSVHRIVYIYSLRRLGPQKHRFNTAHKIAIYYSAVSHVSLLVCVPR